MSLVCSAPTSLARDFRQSIFGRSVFGGCEASLLRIEELLFLAGDATIQDRRDNAHDVPEAPAGALLTALS